MSECRNMTIKYKPFLLNNDKTDGIHSVELCIMTHARQRHCYEILFRLKLLRKGEPYQFSGQRDLSVQTHKYTQTYILL